MTALPETVIEWRDLTLHGTAGPGRRTFVDLAGWEDLDTRQDSADRTQQSGSWDASTFATARWVTAAGRCISAADRDALLAELQAAAADRSLGTLTITHAGRTLSAQARLRSFRPTATAWGAGVFEWVAAWTCPDSLRYGAPVYRTASLAGTDPGVGLQYPLTYPLDYGVPPGVTPGAASLPNAGATAYWPRLRIDGPVPNPVVTCVESGAWIRYNGTVAAGQWLDVDLGARRVLLQGQVSVRTRVSSSGDWLAIPPGGATITWTADAADPAALLSVWGYEMAVS